MYYWCKMLNEEINLLIIKYTYFYQLLHLKFNNLKLLTIIHIKTHKKKKKILNINLVKREKVSKQNTS